LLVRPKTSCSRSVWTNCLLFFYDKPLRSI
jgi:hypothetical protein